MSKLIKAKNSLIIKNPERFYEQQLAALEWLDGFMKSNKTEATLEGYAGTGKTYILKYFLSNICKVSACPTAPTHKALRVVEKLLHRKGKTIQSLHGLRPNLDIANFDISNPQFDPKGQTYMRNYGLVIIDEASMITDDMYELNYKRAEEFNIKILYVGDPLQLPPVTKGNKESMSKSKVFSVENKFTLTQIVRQEKDNPLLELFPLLRNDVINGTTTFLSHIFKQRSNKFNGGGYEILNENSFNKILKDYFTIEKINENMDSARVISYTNMSVKINNNYIRRLLTNSKDILCEDDVLTSYSTIVDEFNQPIIINSEDYYIEHIRPYTNENQIKTFAVNLRSMYDNRQSLTLQIVDHTHESFKTYYKILNYLHSEAINSKASNRAKNWIKYFKFKDSMLTMISFRLNERNNNRIVSKDIDYGYSLTTHKSQGSTFKNVLIDLEDILYWKTHRGVLKSRPNSNNIINRLIYVAVSRATDKAIFKL